MKVYIGQMVSSSMKAFDELKEKQEFLIRVGVSYELGPIHTGDRGYVAEYGLATHDDFEDAKVVHQTIMDSYATRGITLTITTEQLI